MFYFGTCLCGHSPGKYPQGIFRMFGVRHHSFGYNLFQRGLKKKNGEKESEKVRKRIIQNYTNRATERIRLLYILHTMEWIRRKVINAIG